jgi:inner membrane protein
MPPKRREDGLDNITHTLVGATISKAGAERATPLATATLVIAANAPDIDILSYFRGEYFGLSFRRGITHGWPALLVLPFVVTALMLVWDRLVRLRRDPEAEPARAGPLLAISFAGLITHPALDWMNTYGMRWGLPFDPSWSYGDALFIVDPWIWLTLGGAVFYAASPGRAGTAGWALLGAFTSAVMLLTPVPVPAKWIWLAGVTTVVGARLRGRPTTDGGTRAVRIAGVSVVVYIGAMLASSTAASGVVERAAAAAGIDVRDLMVAPRPADPFSADLEVLTDAGYVPGSFHWFGTPQVALRPTDAVPLFATSPPDDLPIWTIVEDSARAIPRVRHFLSWSRYPYVRIDAEGTDWTVSFRDARYDDQPGAGGLSGVRVRLGPDFHERETR